MTFNGKHILNFLKTKADIYGVIRLGTKSLCFVLILCNCYHVIDIPVTFFFASLIKLKTFYHVRTFYCLQGGYPTCEVGLIMYNPNPSLGTF